MIQRVSQIEKEFLIKTVIKNAQHVRFHGLSTAGMGLITGLDRNVLTVSLLDTFDNSGFSICEHLTGYFDFHGTTYAFETTVRDCQARQLKMDQPDSLLRSLQRKFVRVRKPKDVRVVFHLANEEIQLDYPVCPEYISVEDDTQQNCNTGNSLADLICSFKQEVADKCTDNTIIMFRTKKPVSFEETLISSTGKVLYIPSTSSGLPKNDPYPEGRIITEYLEEQFEDPDYFVSGSKFGRMLKEKKERGIASEIWCPIVYYQYVVGYIYLVFSGTKSFDISMVDYLWEFSRVLAYQLKQTGYFSKEAQNTDPLKHPAKILDMSPGGMLISLPQSEVRSPVKEGSVFSVEISLNKRLISCTAKVTRRFSEKDSVAYGTSFVNLTPEDMISLYEFLYRKPFNEHDTHAYERRAQHSV